MHIFYISKIRTDNNNIALGAHSTPVRYLLTPTKLPLVRDICQNKSKDR